MRNHDLREMGRRARDRVIRDYAKPRKDKRFVIIREAFTSEFADEENPVDPFRLTNYNNQRGLFETPFLLPAL